MPVAAALSLYRDRDRLSRRILGTERSVPVPRRRRWLVAGEDRVRTMPLPPRTPRHARPPMTPLPPTAHSNSTYAPLARRSPAVPSTPSFCARSGWQWHGDRCHLRSESIAATVTSTSASPRARTAASGGAPASSSSLHRAQSHTKKCACAAAAVSAGARASGLGPSAARREAGDHRGARLQERLAPRMRVRTRAGLA
jgi:hypothetical protein